MAVPQSDKLFSRMRLMGVGGLEVKGGEKHVCIKSYQISVMEQCDWDTVYAAKLTWYPFAERDYKPYAQGRLCLCAGGEKQGDRLCVQLLSFESTPFVAEQLLDSSCLTLYLKMAEGLPAYQLTADSTGRARCSLDGRACEAPRVRTFAGEDLQGVYWGVEYTLEGSELARICAGELVPGRKIMGNIVTSRLGSCKSYYGALFPAVPDSEPLRPLGRDWLEGMPLLGEMVLVDY